VLRAEGTKLLAKALKGNQVMTELILSSNGMAIGGMSGVAALADAIPDMGALTKLLLKGNGLLTKDAGKALAGALAGNSVLTELDASNQAGYTWDDGPGFAQELAVGIKDNGALTSLDISNQVWVDEPGEGGLGTEGAKCFAEALKDHP
jgi:hypothetical protein